MKTITAQIRLDSAQFETLENESQNRRIAIDELVSRLVKNYLDELFLSHQRPSVDFMSIVGMGNSGADEVSQCHDQYLGEALADEHLR